MNIILFDSLGGLSNGEFVIDPDDPRSRHIIKVLKLKVGDTFSMGLIQGQSGIGTVTDIHHGAVAFIWTPLRECSVPHPVTLMAGAVRPICMKRILREAVSLGVRRIIITGTDLGEKSYLEASIWKNQVFRSFLIDGAQQAGITYIPRVELFRRCDDALREHTGRGIVLDVGEGNVRLADVSPQELPATLAIGSERGWSDRERELFRKNGWTFAGMGSRILRTETACSAGLAVLLARLGLI